MGDVSNIVGLLRAAEANLSAVINPTANARRREGIGAFALPEHAPWRFADPIGATLLANQIVRSNFFRVNCEHIPAVLYQYAVHVYPFKTTENAFDTVDCAGKEDSRILWSLYKKLLSRHPEWNVKKGGTGMSFTGRSTVFTTAILPLPPGSVNDRQEPFFAEALSVPNPDGTESRRRFRVSLTLVTQFPMPRSAQSWAVATEQAILALDSPILSYARACETEDAPSWLTVGSAVRKSDHFIKYLYSN